MKKSLIFLVCVFCAAINLQAQYKINVQNGTKTEFYDNLDTAISSATAGDTLYLPGTVLYVATSTLPIYKKLAIIGAGWDVDSIGGLQTTEIKYGANHVIIQYNENSSGSLLTGCIVQEIRFLRGDSIKDVTIWRNRITGNIRLTYSGSGFVKNITISENFISGDLTGDVNNSGYVSNCMINNNTCSRIEAIADSRIFNNVFGGRMYRLSRCTVENNFISEQENWIYNENCIFKNNAYRQSPALTGTTTTNTYKDNLTGQEVAATFISSGLGHPKNLVVLDTSPCKTGGTYGTEIGIYGGMSPYKPGGVPFNPHINQATIPGQTDQFGNLKVNISVSAQTK